MMDEQAIPGQPVPGSAWVTRQLPAVNTASAVSKTAPGAGKQLVLTHACFTLSSETAHAAAVSTYAYIQNATGIIVWSARMSIPAVAGAMAEVSFDGAIVCVANEPCTAGFISAGGANTYEAVAIAGYIVQV